MTLPEQYRLIFRAPGGDEVLADLVRFIERLPSPEERGGARAVLSRITHMLHVTDPKPKVRAVPASGGRIAHG
jgi:hypothetical protein